MDPIINDILKSFRMAYPDRKPRELFKLDDGYLVSAPRTNMEVDYADPFYFVSSSLDTIETFKMSHVEDLLKAVGRGAIWRAVE